MVPAALMGLEVRKLLEGARQAAQSSDTALQLGTIMGDNANSGRDKLTLVIDEPLASLGLWIEQLIAECPIPRRLSALEIPREVFPRLAKSALTVQRLLKNNPRAVTEDDAVRIYNLAW